MPEYERKENVSMFVYKISELLDNLKSAQNDGYDYVELSIIESEDDMPESISLDYIDDANSSENDIIDAITLPDDYIRSQEL